MATIDTLANRSSGTPAAGKAYFETSTNKFIVYNGSAWIEIDSDGTGAALLQNRWALSLDGQDDAVQANVSSMNLGALSIWFKPTDEMLTSSTQTVFAHTQNTGYYSMRSAFSGNLLTFYGSGASNSVHFNPTTYNNAVPSGQQSVPTSFAAGTWQHIVLTYDSNSGHYRFYLNGQDVTTSSVAQSQATTSLIGISRPAGYAFYNFLKGEIDDLAIWSGTGLSESQIQDIYNGTPGVVGSGAPNDLTAVSSLSSYQPSYLYRMGDDSNDSPSAGVAASSITDSMGSGVGLAQSTASAQPTFSAIASSETIYV